jgi:large subunit ribosomal protein LP0
MSEEEVSGSGSEVEETTPVVESKTDEFKGLTKRKIKKIKYARRLNQLFDEYKSILIIGIDNVGSSQMQSVRMAIRGKAVMLMGKNTMIRSIIKKRKDPKLMALLPAVKMNIGFIFTNGDLSELRKSVTENKVPAAAKAGAIAPTDVNVPPGPTGMDPGQTAFFQALSIATKIERGNITIIDEVALIKAGDKVSPSHVVLLQKLNIMPFFYGITVATVYDDGTLFDAAVLDLTEADLKNKFMSGVAKIAALSFETGYPCTASVPFQMRYAFKRLVALSLESGYEFKEAKDFIEAAASGAAAAAAASGPATEAPKEEKKVEESEEESVGGLGGMF